MALAEESELTSIMMDYRRGTPLSQASWDRASRVFPQGISDHAKWVAAVPVFADAAVGSHIINIDGHDCVDPVMGSRPWVVRHSHLKMVATVKGSASRMFNPTRSTTDAIVFAHSPKAHVPHLESLSFDNTGSDSTRSAARPVMGRALIAKFEGNAHGPDDLSLISTNSSRFAGPRGAPRRSSPVLP